MSNLGLSLWTGMSGRNLFNGGTIDQLSQKFKIDIVSPFIRSKPSLSRFSKLSMSNRQKKMISMLYQVQYYAHWYLHKPSTLNKYMRRDRERNPFRFYVLSFLGKLYGNYRQSKDEDFVRNYIYFLPTSLLNELQAVFLTSTDCPFDQLLIYAARKQNIPSIVLTHSWDNLPARGMLSARPNRLLVWNELMKSQAINLHSIPEENISVIGVPQYEWYRKLSAECDEKSFRFKNKIAEGKKVITYTAGAQRVFPDEEYFVEELRNYISERSDLVFILRLHPEERKQFYLERYENDSTIIISNPDNGFRANATEDFGTKKAVVDFISLMKYSGVVINLASTVTLDAVLFDTPTICPSFNYICPSEAWNAAHRWYESSHFSEISRSGAVPISNSFEELIDNINDALLMPARLSDERKALSEVMMPDLQTSRLICEAVEEVVSS